MSLLSLLVPWWGGSHLPLKRTIDSCAGLVDEVVIVHQQLFDEDAEIARAFSPKVATLDWNACMKHGFGYMTSQGIPLCNGPWVLWLGTGETIAEQLIPVRNILSSCKNRSLVYRVNHHNDSNLWQRFFCPSSGNHISGLIHEDVNGEQSYVIARMADTVKEPHPDQFHNEVLKWYKTCVYNHLYRRLLENPHELGNAHAGWLSFVRGAKESILAFCELHDDLISATLRGDREAFYDGVRRRMDEEQKPTGCNYQPLGEPMSEGA